MSLGSIGPAAHHGSTPIKDPRVPGNTSGGDGAGPARSRPHREIAIGAMVLVVVLGALAAWMLFKPAGDDTAARASAAKVGLTVSSQWRVEAIGGGFRVVREFAQGSAYYFDIVETLSVSAPANASSWQPTITGATAYAENDPPITVYIDAGAHSWIVTCGTPWIYRSDQTAGAAWHALADAISFAPGA